jgi:hypothetical protein
VLQPLGSFARREELQIANWQLQIEARAFLHRQRTVLQFAIANSQFAMLLVAARRS